MIVGLIGNPINTFHLLRLAKDNSILDTAEKMQFHCFHICKAVHAEALLYEGGIIESSDRLS